MGVQLLTKSILKNSSLQNTPQHSCTPSKQLYSKCTDLDGHGDVVLPEQEHVPAEVLILGTLKIKFSGEFYNNRSNEAFNSVAMCQQP